MGDWHELGQAVFIGLVFSFIVAKLISTVISFREENLKVVRQEDLPDEPLDSESKSLDTNNPNDPTTSDTGKSRDGEGGEEKGVGISEGIMGGEDDEEEEDDDDWEGIESTELDEAFSAATTFVAASAADRLSAKVSNDVQLQLYGLYKIATEGPCTAPQPSALKMASRAKWNAWQKLGAMPPEEAMHKYIMIVSELYPSWAAGSTTTKSQGEGSNAPSSTAKGTMGPVFSSFVHQEESDNELKLHAIHAAAREGDADELLKYLDDGIVVNLRDSEGRTPLHWAVDRGHLNVAEILITRKADVNAKDNEGQTPLHYAVVCEREAIAEFLIKHEADRDAKDNDNNSPRGLCVSAWVFMSSDN